MSKKLKRNMVIVLSPEEDGKSYRVHDKVANEILSPTDDYHIYFKDIEFRKDGYVIAIYLGETDGKLLDEYCIKTQYNKESGWHTERRKTVSKARMASVHNGNGLVIISE